MKKLFWFILIVFIFVSCAGNNSDNNGHKEWDRDNIAFKTIYETEKEDLAADMNLYEDCLCFERYQGYTGIIGHFRHEEEYIAGDTEFTFEGEVISIQKFYSFTKDGKVEYEKKEFGKETIIEYKNYQGEFKIYYYADSVCILEMTFNGNTTYYFYQVTTHQLNLCEWIKDTSNNKIYASQEIQTIK